jgi:hypothetical protein
VLLCVADAADLGVRRLQHCRPFNVIGVGSFGLEPRLLGEQRQTLLK